MARQQWYVRHGKEVAGPLTSREFSDLAKLEVIERSTDVSPDKTRWFPAERVTGLKFGEPLGPRNANSSPLPPPMPPVAPSPPAEVPGKNNSLSWPMSLLVGALLLAAKIHHQKSTSHATRSGLQPSGKAIVAEAPMGNPANRIPAPVIVPARRVHLTWFDGTLELQRVMKELSPEQIVVLGFAALMTKKDLYAAHVLITNTGTQPVYISPENVRIHMGNDTSSGLVTADQRFLQRQFLQPNTYAEGLVMFSATFESGKLVRHGGGKVSYQDATIIVTYPLSHGGARHVEREIGSRRKGSKRS